MNCAMFMKSLVIWPSYLLRDPENTEQQYQLWFGCREGKVDLEIQPMVWLQGGKGGSRDITYGLVARRERWI